MSSFFKHSIILFLIALLYGSCINEQEVKPFKYVPPTPVGGKLKGVVELGSYGFNSFIIKMDKQGEWELKNAEYGVNTIYDTNDIKSIIRALRAYINHMESFGVLDREIHFIVSSGAIKEPKVQRLIRIIRETGYVVNIATPEQEAQYVLRAILPNIFKKNAFAVDIGSGNTKVAWEEGKEIRTLETVGAQYLQRGISDEEAVQGVVQLVSHIPQEYRKICFIIGGVPYEMAKQYRKNKERYTVLRRPVNYHFGDKRMDSGVNIYKTIRETTGCERFVFDWNGNFAIGFLLSLNY